MGSIDKVFVEFKINNPLEQRKIDFYKRYFHYLLKNKLLPKGQDFLICKTDLSSKIIEKEQTLNTFLDSNFYLSQVS